MKRSHRAELAQQTVDIVGKGSYQSAGNRMVDIASSVSACLEATRLFSADDMAELCRLVRAAPNPQHATTFEVINETTLAGVARLHARGPVAVLNFASAKNPGGGFLGGSQAQEESLARSSALYASLLRALAFYESHRASPSLLYSDAMILSPHCPIFRDDDGALLDEPRVATFISSPAPNAGAIATNRKHEADQIPEVFRRRSENVLALAAAHGYQTLILGAWGCGVFRNDPALVAGTFADHLLRGAWTGRFQHVAFSVLDTSENRQTLEAFEKAFAVI